jgi:L-alanine-DL-glutamate epimerase-like enolase superfamily enzyme
MAGRASLEAKAERWPLARQFTISRGSRTEAAVVVVEVSDGEHKGRGECVPYARYGETIESVVSAIESLSLDGLNRPRLQEQLPAGAVRNAIDCALWDLEAKRSGIPAWQAAGLDEIRAVTTAYTLSLGSAEEMHEAARDALPRPPLLGLGNPLLKVKLGGDGDAGRIVAVRRAAPNARLIADANEAWSEANFSENMAACARAGVELIEQPLPAGKDEMLREIAHIVPICADESAHTSADLPALQGKYDAVNVKLDKAGGLTEALAVLREARAGGYKVMIGCMVGTSLGIAPALILAQKAEFVDLDGPLLLARDRAPGLRYFGVTIEPPDAELWG